LHLFVFSFSVCFWLIFIVFIKINYELVVFDFIPFKLYQELIR